MVTWQPLLPQLRLERSHKGRRERRRGQVLRLRLVMVALLTEEKTCMYTALRLEKEDSKFKASLNYEEG